MKKAFLFLGLSVLLFSNSAVAQNLPSYLPSNGLVGWWPFNGNANDESGNGNDGVNNNALLCEDRASATSSAYLFQRDIVNEINVSHSNSLDNIQSITISLWVNLNSYGAQGEAGYNHFVNKSDGANQHHFVFANNSSQLYFYYTNGNNAFLTNNLPPLNSWSNIAVSYQFDNVSNSYCKFYIDGDLVDSMLTTQPLSLSNYDLKIGSFSGAFYDRVDGKLDDIAIYNRPLTQEEITALYTGTPVNGGGGNTSANPVPPGIPYQAVVRNANGQVAVNTAVTTRFTLHQNTADGAVEYQETHALTTNAQGLMATVMGQGAAVQNTFATINWANTTKFLQVEVDLGNGYVDLGTQQLMSVPYSIQSQTALTLKNTGLPVYADNAAALAGGLTTGQLYRTSTGDLKIVY
jgi:hypothetical protein